ncbi:N-acetylglucosamine-6-phosphate deacetylase [Vallitalea sp.]|jgi:N-acetylglucosamine-6-phosphate deacetylase|uniref:N-acetylglucosamine-6-phosphate deacetylase n=1 Tax=Vallitalea sp. TaxID=1882829 RepID=UPI0025FC537F|nr:N-acetylglucosamine-6-phosphate deacetylase [Vallitalea sp.]MCT4687837.1 N-acetylglucosamine-6-phosphate deacetylase [Vallitalea sp.]
MKCIYNGKILIDGKFVSDKVILFDEAINKIIDESQLNSEIIEYKIDAKGNYIVPGFIDVHIHGYKGHDTMDGDIDTLRFISKSIPENGVTSFLPTTMTMDVPIIRKALDTIKTLMDEKTYGAEVLGTHLEGPFISEKYKGAQSEEFIKEPDGEVIKGYEDIIKIITIAPEVEGSLDFIEKHTKDYGIRFSMGHSAASYDEAMAGIEKGVCSCTHFFNAMTGLHHRNPGVVGAVMNSDIRCEVIADTIHVNKALFNLIARVKGMDKVLLITDAIMGAGLSDGEYSLGGQKVFLENSKCMLSDGTIAGSSLKLNKAIYNFTKYSDYSLEKVIELATINQAKYIGVEDRKGTLDIGKDADITVIDDKLAIYYTIGKGKTLYEKPN